ncbi:MAG: hypothetical protein CL812_15435 [Confluentimicrobium sp.]|nr:hypothetical protein [Actibacterium sp.]|tara:strand:- start:176 stop:418 length:243 start_codon:yes stop_codon:yes gene_type:complete
MSAPHTDIDKQERRHKGPLAGMKLVVGFAVLLLVLWVGWVVIYGSDPEGADTQIDGRTGTVEQTEETPQPGQPETLPAGN